MNSSPTHDYSFTDYSFTDELIRLQSFENWPSRHIIHPIRLAKAGFYFLNQDDKTKCAFCSGIVGNWEPQDDPDEEHKRHFPYCPFVLSVIQHRLENVEASNMGPNVSLDTQSLHDTGIHLHPGPYGVIFPTLESRIDSFREWPSGTVQTPDMLAEAGFYYLGFDDAVECFSCGGAFKNWNADDDPWREHARAFPMCNYLLLVKGRDFVEECSTRVNTNEHQTTTIGGEDSSSEHDNVEPHSGAEIPSTSNNSNFTTTVTNPTRNSQPSPTNHLNERKSLEANGANSVENRIMCKICMSNEVGVVFLPCGHLVVCVYCAPNIETCPICRSAIRGLVRTFLS